MSDPFLGTPYRSVRRVQLRDLTEIYEVEGAGGRCLAKILREEFLGEPQVVDRLRLEGDILQVIQHPNVVRLIDRGLANKRPFLVLERLTGHTLRRELVQRGALPATEAAQLALQALDGLEAVHRLAVVHRDLKPDNLFLCRKGRDGRTLKILDFGFAKVLRRGAGRAIAPLALSTSEQEFVGAPRFVAPEQLVMGRTVDERADVYTIGLVLYTMVLGREPHHDVDESGELVRAHLEGKLEQPSPETADRVSRELVAIISKATDPKPSSRFKSAEDFAGALRAFLDTDRAPQPERGSQRRVTVQRHAELTAALEAHPERAEEIRGQFGLSSSRDVRALQAWWQSNIAADPKVHEKWRALVDLYAARLRAKTKKGR